MHFLSKQLCPILRQEKRFPITNGARVKWLIKVNGDGIARLKARRFITVIFHVREASSDFGRINNGLLLLLEQRSKLILLIGFHLITKKPNSFFNHKLISIYYS